MSGALVTKIRRKKAVRNPRKATRAYTVTPAVMAQRRAAAVKTGRYATRPMGALGIPCKRSRCPLESLGGGFDSCPIRRISIERQGAPPEVCTAVIGGVAPPPQVDVYLAAIEGDLGPLGKLQAQLFAEVAQFTLEAASDVRREGLVTRVYVEGLGEVRQLHPAATALPSFLRLLGTAAQDWKLTPASQGQNHGAGDELDQDLLELYRRTEGGAWEAKEEEARA